MNIEPLYLVWKLLINPVTGDYVEQVPYIDPDTKKQAEPMPAELCNAYITGRTFQLENGKAVFLICERIA